MAAIGITVSTTNDLFTITLDKWEWTALYIKENGVWVAMPSYPDPTQPDLQFRYTQSSPGPLSFKAVADTNLVVVNPSAPMLMAGPNGQHTYLAMLNYTTSPSEVHMLGLLETFDEAVPDAQPSPMFFSQGRMTGVFSTSN